MDIWDLVQRVRKSFKDEIQVKKSRGGMRWKLNLIPENAPRSNGEYPLGTIGLNDEEHITFDITQYNSSRNEMSSRISRMDHRYRASVHNMNPLKGSPIPGRKMYAAYGALGGKLFKMIEETFYIEKGKNGYYTLKDKPQEVN